MIEKMTFDFSGLVKDKSNKEEIEFWGHDAGEFVAKEVIESLKAESQKEQRTTDLLGESE